MKTRERERRSYWFYYITLTDLQRLHLIGRPSSADAYIFRSHPLAHNLIYYVNAFPSISQKLLGQLSSVIYV